MNQDMYEKHGLDQQRKLLELGAEQKFPPFEERLRESGLYPLTATGITTLQLNVGRLCNQTCRHCHVTAGPKRKEIMSREIFQACLDALDKSDIPVVDITGGSPELNPNFRWFVQEVVSRKRHVIDRCNLTVVLEKGQDDLIDFLAAHQVEVVASLPATNKEQTDAQRGEEVFERSVKALGLFNSAGYGVDSSDLQLHLMTNPTGAFLPPSQSSLEARWKKELQTNYGVSFNKLYTLANMPIGRYLTFLESRGLLVPYINKLVDSYNPSAAVNVMCRYTLSVDWRGYLYDCDFNQMLELKVDHGLAPHIRDFDPERLHNRQIVTRLHCYGCTAGAGSSCGGAIVE